MIKLQVTNVHRGGAGTRLEAVFQADDDPQLTPELYLELVAGLEELGQRLGGLSWRVSATPWATYKGDGRQVEDIKAEVSALAAAAAKPTKTSRQQRVAGETSPAQAHGSAHTEKKG